MSRQGLVRVPSGSRKGWVYIRKLSEAYQAGINIPLQSERLRIPECADTAKVVKSAQKSYLHTQASRSIRRK